MTAVTPLSGLAQRMPVIGTLRNGAKTANGAPKSIDKWRLTTSSLPYAEAFAARYGGEVQPWQGQPGQFEVFSDSTEINIALIPDGFDISYQLWSAGGMQRKCDGVTCEILQTTGPDNVEYVEQGCICDRKQELECSLRSRLTFVLPDLPFGGGVVYKTGSKNFAEEAQGMLRLIQQMQAQGINRGYLRLEQRRSSGNRKYTIATVGIRESLEALASGEAGMASLGRAADSSAPSTAPALGAGESGPSQPDSPSTEGTGGSPSPAPSPASEGGDVTGEGASPPDEDIVDAEIIEDHGNPSERAALIGKFQGIVKGASLSYDEQVRPWLVHHYGVSLSDLPFDKLQGLVSKLADGTQFERTEARKKFKASVEEYAEVLA